MSNLVDVVLDVAARELRIGQRKIPLLQLADHDFDALQANPNTRDVVGFPTVFREREGDVQFWPAPDSQVRVITP